MKSEEIRKKSKDLQETVRADGYTIDVKHSRIMRGFVAINKRGEPDTCLTRQEFAHFVRHKNYIADFQREDGPQFSDYVEPNGGFVTVILYYGNTEISRAKGNFGPRTPYFKADGTYRALLKAYQTAQKLQEVFSEGQHPDRKDGVLQVS